LGPTLVLVTALNHGSRTVSLNSPGLLLPDKRQLVFPFDLESDVPFPHDLMEGKSCQMWIPASVLARDLRKYGFSGDIKLRGFYRDALGTIHKSKPFKFEADKWLSESG
jgi:hypothetical protein